MFEDISVLQNHSVKFMPIEVEETSYQPFKDGDIWDCETFKEKVSYPAMYFPNFLDAAYIADSEEEFDDLRCEFYQCGNESQFCKMNESLKKLINVYTLYSKDSIPKDAFEMILKGYIESLKE